MDISNAKCPGCGAQMKIARTVCPECEVSLEGDIEISTLGRLSLEDQIFVIAFLRHHGSIKRMEGLFGISYPTVKNRLNAIVTQLDRGFAAPSAQSAILTELARGKISVQEALERLG